jgi:S-adenosylmethionine synthetase
MQSHLRFAEAVCAGHPDRLADTIADRIVRLACTRDPDALASIEVALYRRHVFVDGQILGGTGPQCVLSTADIEPLVQRTYRDAGYGPTAGGLFPPEPDSLTVTCELCLAPLGAEERELRRIADDQAIVVGHAVWGPRAGHIPLEQALANEFAAELDAMRAARPDLRMGPDGKVLVVVRGRTLVGVSISVHHLPSAEWGALTSTVRAACSRVGREFVEAGELEPFDHADWLVNGAGAFELGGPLGDNGSTGKKLVVEAYGASIPIGGGARAGKDPHKVDPRGQARARQMALDLVISRRAAEATVWLAWRPGDVEPRWTEVLVRG